MAKKVISGVEKRIKNPLIERRLKKKKKKSLLKKVLDYLLSDSYMFAPLVSHYPCDFLASNTVVSSSSTPGVEINKELGKNNQGLVENVGSYLNSDPHLYAPLFAPKHIDSPKGVNGEHIKRARIDTSKNKTLHESGETTVEKSKTTVVEKVKQVMNEKDDVPEKRKRRSNVNISGQEKLVEKGTVKHMVYQSSCRTSSMSGKRLDPRLRMWLRKKYLME
ncbi:hypothetical protein M5689_011765 [Euphorbia peplus]|nr:hypothetical protein M5689_011765 [Euphorbia peplus]